MGARFSQPVENELMPVFHERLPNTVESRQGSSLVVRATNGPLERMISEEKEKAKALRAALLLALAYAATFGATASYSGNVSIRRYISSHDMSMDMTFATWWLLHFPFSLLMMVVASTLIPSLLLRNYENGDSSLDSCRTVVADRLDMMGHATYREYMVGFLFTLLLLLLVFREPAFMSGWAHWLGVERDLKEASVGIMVALLAFLFPSEVLPEKGGPLLEWADLHRRLPWGVIFLLGGAATISAAIEENGLFEKVEQMLPVESVGFLQYLVLLLIGCLGEVMTLESRLKHFIHIGEKLAEKLHRQPLFLLLPINIMCQFSLILPSSAPGNAMAFEMSSMTSLQMIMPGIVIKLLGVVLYMIIVNSIALTSFTKDGSFQNASSTWTTALIPS